MSDNKRFAVSVATTKPNKAGLEVMSHLSIRIALNGDEAKGAFITELLKQFPDRQIASCCVSLDLDTSW